MDQQYNKNLLINHSMMLYLQDKIGFLADMYELLALHVEGWTATVFCLKQFDGIFISDLVTDHALVLPHSPSTWRAFLEGKDIVCIWSYMNHLIKVAENIEKQEDIQRRSKATAYKRTREDLEPKSLGQFTYLSPAKSRSTSEADTESSSSSQ